MKIKQGAGSPEGYGFEDWLCVDFISKWLTSDLSDEEKSKLYLIPQLKKARIFDDIVTYWNGYHLFHQVKHTIRLLGDVISLKELMYTGVEINFKLIYESYIKIKQNFPEYIPFKLIILTNKTPDKDLLTQLDNDGNFSTHFIKSIKDSNLVLPMQENNENTLKSFQECLKTLKFEIITNNKSGLEAILQNSLGILAQRILERVQAARKDEELEKITYDFLRNTLQISDYNSRKKLTKFFFDNQVIWVKGKIGELSGESEFNTDSIKLFGTCYQAKLLNLLNFSDRRKDLYVISQKMYRTLEVSGIGGVGKTALCDIALILYRLAGYNVCYLAPEVAYLSGSGFPNSYLYFIKNQQNLITLDVILNQLGIQNNPNLSEQQKINNIIRILNKDPGTILVLDDIQESNEIIEFLKTCNDSLTKGCVIFTTKQLMGVGYNRVVLQGIEDERYQLTKIFAERLGLSPNISEYTLKSISELAEGHPIATYILIASTPYISISKLKSIKENVSITNQSDFHEYMKRVIELSLNDQFSFKILKEIALIKEPMDRILLEEAITDISPNIQSSKLIDDYIKKLFLIFSSRLLNWTFIQVRDLLWDEEVNSHQIAVNYFSKKADQTGNINDHLSLVYHKILLGEIKKTYFDFLDILVDLKPNMPINSQLFTIGDLLLTRDIEINQKAQMQFELTKAHLIQAVFQDRRYHCERAEKLALEALIFFTQENYPNYFVLLHKYLANVYILLSSLKNPKENCTKALKKIEIAQNEAQKYRFTELFPGIYNDLSNIYRALADLENSRKNIELSIQYALDALHLLNERDRSKSAILNNIASSYQKLVEIFVNREENANKALHYIQESISLQ